MIFQMLILTNITINKLQIEFTKSVVFLLIGGTIQIRQTDIFMCGHFGSLNSLHLRYILYYFFVANVL